MAQDGREAKGVKIGKHLTLVVGQSLFHSGKLSTRAKGLMEVQHEGVLGLNPADADRIGVTDGDRVRLVNQSGEMTTIIRRLDRVPEGMAVFPEHFDEAARGLMTVSVDPVTRVPYCKSAKVTVQRA